MKHHRNLGYCIIFGVKNILIHFSVLWTNFQTCSCPVCRFELPTDDADFEEMRRQSKRAQQREHDLEQLHGSMFG